MRTQLTYNEIEILKYLRDLKSSSTIIQRIIHSYYVHNHTRQYKSDKDTSNPILVAVNASNSEQSQTGSAENTQPYLFEGGIEELTDRN